MGVRIWINSRERRTFNPDGNRLERFDVVYSCSCVSRTVPQNSWTSIGLSTFIGDSGVVDLNVAIMILLCI